MPWLAPPGMRSFGHGGVNYTAVEVLPGVYHFHIPGPLTPADADTFASHGLVPVPTVVANPAPPSSSPPSSSPPPDTPSVPGGDDGEGKAVEPPPETGWDEDAIDTMTEDQLKIVAEAIDLQVDGRWSKTRLRTQVAAALKEKGLLIPAKD